MSIPFGIADTGEDIEARGLGILGGGIANLTTALDQIAEAEGVSQAATARAQSNKEMRDLELRLKENNDPSTYQDEFKKSLQTVEGFRPKSGIGSKRFDDMLSRAIPAWESGVEVLRFNKTKDIAEGAYISNLSDAIVSSDIETATAVIEEARDTGVITNEQAEKDLASLPDRIIESQITTLLNNASQFITEKNFEDSLLEIERAEAIINDPDIGISQQAERALRSQINTAKAVAEAQAKDGAKQLIDKTTSDTIREYFNNTLNIQTLNQRHKDGLIKDSEFKFMIKGLTETTPANTDPFASGRVRRAMKDFEMGVITRAETDRIVLENYIELDGPDRSKVVADIEDIAAKVIATAKSNAYDEGRSLMSRAFVGINSFDQLLDIFGEATDENKRRISRRFTAEVNNRELYERAVDDRFKEMRKENISGVSKYTSESLRILLQYQKRRTLNLEELEEIVGKEQREIIGGLPQTTKPNLVPTSGLQQNELLQELQRVRNRQRQLRAQ